MPAPVEINPWHWGGFIVGIGLILAFDLGVFNRQSRVIGFREAMGWTAVWVALSLLFACVLGFWRGQKDSMEFLTGYFVELSLSVDNVLVIAVVFTNFRTPAKLQHRVLFWGIIGAVLMRGIFIWLGVQLITRFDWLLYVFGAFLVLSGAKMLLTRSAAAKPGQSPMARFARKLFSVSDDIDEGRFFLRRNGRLFLTPLFLALVVVETSDLIFATDSIPAVFGVTRNPFLVFTSNVFAILGLRSLYFLLAGVLSRFRHLKRGVSTVLVFIGVKMLIDPHDNPPRWFQYDIPDGAALLVTAGIIGISMLMSLAAGHGGPGTAEPSANA